MTAVIENVPEVRREWGVVLGDFLHNTRSALSSISSAPWFRHSVDRRLKATSSRSAAQSSSGGRIYYKP